MRRFFPYLLLLILSVPVFLFLNYTATAPATFRQVWVQFYPDPQPQQIWVQEIQGHLIYEGDIEIPWDALCPPPNQPFLFAGNITRSVQNAPWPQGRIPYAFKDNVNERLRSQIERAIVDLNKKTNLQFVPHSDEENYALFSMGHDYNWARVGMQKGANVIHLKDERVRPGMIKHEILHVAGLHHEHARADRDEYIEFLRENMRNGKLNFHFGKKNERFITHGPYDFASIMHYSEKAYSKNGEITIRSIVPDQSVPKRQVQVLSPGDIAALAALYPQKDSAIVISP